MKNKLYLILIFFVFSANTIKAQYYSETSVVAVKAGYVQRGFAGILEYDYFIARGQYLSGDIMITFSNQKVTNLKVNVPYSGIYFNAGYNYQVYEAYQSLTLFNIGIGLSGGYQILNNGDKDLKTGALIKSESKFVYGGYLSANTRIYITRNLHGSVYLRQHYHQSDIGKFFPFLGGGLEYTLF